MGDARAHAPFCVKSGWFPYTPRRSSIFSLSARRQMNLFVWQMRSRRYMFFWAKGKEPHAQKPLRASFPVSPWRKNAHSICNSTTSGAFVAADTVYTWETHPVGISASNAVLCETEGEGCHLGNFYDAILLTCLSLKGKVSHEKYLFFYTRVTQKVLGVVW
jgi:hypothetical protein